MLWAFLDGNSAGDVHDVWPVIGQDSTVKRTNTLLRYKITAWSRGLVNQELYDRIHERNVLASW